MDPYFKLHATQFKLLTQIETHPLHYFNAYSDPYTSQVTSKCKKYVTGVRKNFDGSGYSFSKIGWFCGSKW